MNLYQSRLLFQSMCVGVCVCNTWIFRDEEKYLTEERTMKVKLASMTNEIGMRINFEEFPRIWPTGSERKYGS